jgi:acyl-coenzyme A synthetase/AMP-(fatty) acid ligase
MVVAPLFTATLASSMNDMVFLQRHTCADALVAFGGRGSLSAARFHLDVLNLAKQFQLSPLSTWAIGCEDAYFFAASLMALAVAGKTAVLPGHLRVQQLQENFNAGCFQALLVEETLIKKNSDFVSGIPALLVCAVDGLIATAHDDESNLYLSNSAWVLAVSPLAIVRCYTSGSTGYPKAIDKTYAQLGAELNILYSLFGDAWSGAEVLATVSCQHLYGLLFRILLPLYAGAAFCRDTLEYPEQLVAQASDARILIASPALLRRLDQQLSAVHYRSVYSSGGVLPFVAAHMTQMLLGQLPLEIYGSTETGGIAWRQQYTESECWQVLPDIVVSQNDEKQLVLNSPFIEQKNYVTDDLVEFNSPERFLLLGRADRIVKIEEKRIALDDVERRLRECDGIDDAAVVVIEQGIRTVLGAVLVLQKNTVDIAHYAADNMHSFFQMLRHDLLKVLDPVAIPRRFRIVDSIPVNAQGKRQTVALRELFSCE